MTHIDIQPRVTKTAQFIGAGVDVSLIPTYAEWTLVLEVSAMNAGDAARFVFEDSNNSFTTYNTDIFSGPSASLNGSIATSATVRLSWRQRDFPDLRIGIIFAKLRLNLVDVTGVSQSVTYRAWIEY